jgi:pyruvate/2-oxoacid:ferredoxin oxidoreductase beta subunit/Pyruvate/2-oxoacid:ferredoxin oxidoreductase gamma subunit
VSIDMTQSDTLPVAATYRNERDYPFCPGCGHGLILDQLNAALVKLSLDPRRVAIVTDIGCQGLGDQYFATHAFHGLHGRSIAYASGIKLADPDLKVIVLMGDGGTGIGGAHLLNAARRNIGLTVLVFNNFNFGMTGGEHSVTTPPGGVTATTRAGNVERPLDVCATVAVNGAGFVWRGTAFDRDLADVIAEAIRSETFALLDIWELCTAYYVPNNEFSRKSLEATRAALGMNAGVLCRETRPEYARALRGDGGQGSGGAGERRSGGEREVPLRPRPLPAQFTSALDREFRFVIAGSAGGKVRSSARMIGEAAILSGLWAAQQDDYPVTVQTGHSISELIFSPREILFTGVTRPDALVLVSEDGRRMAGRYLRALTPESWLFVTPEHAGLETPARTVVLDFEAAGIKGSKKNLGLLMAAAALQRLNLFPIAACEEAIRRGTRSPLREEHLEILAQGALTADPLAVARL